MQKFKEELKNVPMNTSLVHCSTNSQLNKEETLSVENKILTLNNPEVNSLQPHTGGLKDSLKNLVCSTNFHTILIRR
jgi:hypothetical protein